MYQGPDIVENVNRPAFCKCAETLMRLYMLNAATAWLTLAPPHMRHRYH